MLTSIFVWFADIFKDIAVAIQTFGAPKAQLIPIRVEVHSKHQRRQVRR